jgi:Tfp pilus assembly protein PilF
MLIAGLGIDRLSFNIQAQYFSEEARKALVAGQFESARENLARAIKLNPNNDKYHSDLGLVCRYQMNWNCAEQQYKQALKLNPEDGTIYYNIADLYEEFGDFDLALKNYELAITYKNDDIELRAKNNWARLQILHKHSDQVAIQILTDALKRSDAPEDLKPNLYKNLGWAYFQAGENQAAEQSLREAIRLDRENRAAPHCLLARILQERKDDEAIAAWKYCRDNESDSYLPEVKIWKLDAHRYLTTETTEGVQP